jgi:hypothetical protein
MFILTCCLECICVLAVDISAGVYLLQLRPRPDTAQVDSSKQPNSVVSSSRSQNNHRFRLHQEFHCPYNSPFTRYIRNSNNYS